MKKDTLFLWFLLISFFGHAQGVPIEIKVEGTSLNAHFYRSPGENLKPTIIWCHGNPGGKESGQSSFTNRISDKGIHVIRYNYRGLWGIPGEYTPASCHIDLQNVLDFAYNPDNSSELGIDTNRIIVAGFSHGSNISLVSALLDQRIDEVFCLGLADFSLLSREFFNPNNKWMKKFNQMSLDAIWGGVTSGQGKYARDFDKYVMDILWNNYKYDFVEQADKLLGKRIFIVVGINDVTVPIEDHFFPLYRKLKEYDHKDFKYVLTESNHSFREMYDGRMSQLIVDWVFEID